MTGQTIAHYEITSKIGEGGMGVVYKARDTHLDRYVAIKVLPPVKVADPDRQRRFVQEAKSASALNHPNIVTVYDVGQQEGVDFIVMEFIEGTPLDELIPPKGMRLSDALKHAAQVADALAAAHEAGIVHRDVKPGNVMVTEKGLVKVLDFGLAKLTAIASAGEDEATSTVKVPGGSSTEEGAILGTVSYMSPEQAQGQKLDARSDIFSFGCVLYQMVTGTQPFLGSTMMSTLAAVINKDPKPVHEFGKGVPSELERIIHHCLQKDRRQRWQSMADVRISLEYLHREGQAGRASQDGRGLQKPRRPVVWVAAAILVGAVSILGAWLGSRATQRAQPRFDLRRVTADSGLTFQPTISPDGTLVAYASDRAGNGDLDLWVQQISGGQPIRLTTHGMDDFEPAFSPDSSQIAFRSDRDGGGVFLVPALGGAVRMITDSGHMPSFSPDGQRLAFRGGDRVVG
ncbi:MAG: serine/threonine-protein kinase, partial [Thermoleophilia bacterium]|nr:serine/threonine-protein kinase [Thermoleophilia bacterium]